MIEQQTQQWPDYTYIVPQTYSKAKVRVSGMGYYVPAGVVTNEFWSYVTTRLGEPRSAADFDHGSGLSERHVRAETLELCRRVAGRDAPGLIDSPAAPTDESLIDMAVIAAQRALASAGRDPSEVDAVIGASSSDNYGFPTVAGLVQMRLGIPPVRAIMLKGACSSQTEAFQSATEMLAASSTRTVLITITEGLLPNVMHVLDWRISSLFGEGAAAYLLERGDEEDDMYAINGYNAALAPSLHGQTPLRKDIVEMAEEDMRIQRLYEQGESAQANAILARFLVGYAKMNGKDVFRVAPRAMAECIDALARHAALPLEDVGHIIPHQANARIIHRMGEILVREYGWPPATMEKLAIEFRYHGNISNVSVATALVELLHRDELHDGQWIAAAAVGAGLHYGGMLWRHHDFKDADAVMPS